MRTEALRANLERTAVEVAIPREHEVLLEIVAPFHGIRQSTEALLREIHHRYPGWRDTLPELHQRAMGDFYYYNAHPRGDKGLGVFCDLYLKVVVEAMPEELRGDALRRWVAFLHKIIAESGEVLERNLFAVDRSLGKIQAAVDGSHTLAAASSEALKRLARELSTGDRTLSPTADKAAAVLHTALDRVYELWLEREDPLRWLSRLDAPIPDRDLLPALDTISHVGLERARSRLRSTVEKLSLDELQELPDHSTIVRAYLDAADELDGAASRRDRWLCFILGEELLAPIHEPALWALGRSSSKLVAESDRVQFERFVREVFEVLRHEDLDGAAPLDLIRRLGTSALENPRPGWAELVIDEILSVHFHRPDFSGFTDEWTARTNPNHLKNVRTYLDIIRTDPAGARRLLAALVINVHMGGVYAADTDLLQKDVSRLLAADIGPVYHQVRHLLRRLPVHFSDIGAEGALRDVSTRIDEIGHRRDPICHFLRKQSHVESNPILIEVVEELARFWASGEPEALQEFLPEHLHDRLDVDDPQYRPLHRLFARLDEREPGLDALFTAPFEDVEAALASVEAVPSNVREKAALLFRLRAELVRKYGLEHDDVIDRLRRLRTVDEGQIDGLEADLGEGRFESALETLLHLLEELQGIVLSGDAREAFEDIYRKRHIGTGIPSMYGRYREERLEAIGLSFRIESLTGALFDRTATEPAGGNLSPDTLRLVRGRLGLLARALAIEGFRTEDLMLRLSVLEDAMALPQVSREELIDVFRGIADGVNAIVRTQILEAYGHVFETLTPQMLEHGEIAVGKESPEEAVMAATERFLRELIADDVALQRIDNLTGAVLRALEDLSDRWLIEPAGHPGLPLQVVPIFGSGRPPGPLHLGNKGFMLTRLARYGFPTPPGFIIPTGLFRSSSDGEYSLPPPLVVQVRRELRRLEKRVGSRFGDPADPLLLSVRGGAPMSMPGMIDTILDVGINPDIAEGLAKARNSPWAAWDGYRRFLQFWGMSRGVHRDRFDDLIAEAKRRFSVSKKSHLTPQQMKNVAGDYRALLADHGVEVADEPFEQLLSAISLVLASWDSTKARAYRSEMQIADDWGTAVIVQNMVYGNLDERSGTGALLTHHPEHDPDTFQLVGDFVIQGQGDDVVSGLVETFPISERQRHALDSPRPDISLESSFPSIYERLDRLARSLVEERSWPHQEIEFTFESDDPGDVYILQTRAAVTEESEPGGAFAPTKTLRESRLAVGVGVGGGALSCRMALNEANIERLRSESPHDPVLLVRPDTVPDDIHLVFRADALLTAIGGATSHAAVVAKQLGKTCVVGCRDLRVDDAAEEIEIAGRVLVPGDWISISGHDGSVYAGRHRRESPGRVSEIGATA